MKKTLIYTMLFLAVSSFVVLGVCYALSLTWQGNAFLLFSYPDYHFAYAPSTIYEWPAESHFFCMNRDSGVVKDYVYLKQYIYQGGQWVPQTERLVLSPSASGWDCVHVCDPAVVKGSFAYNGTTYQWAMFYTGCNTNNNTNCQIGVAFANSLTGPWVKWGNSPLITTSQPTQWGVGQPSATSVNGAGRVLLFFTRGDTNGTRVLRVDANLSNMSNPSIGGEVLVPTAGLTAISGPVIFHNADFAYDPSRNKFFVVRPRHPFDPQDPSWVSSQLQVASINGSAIWSGTGTWQVLGNISSAQSGHARNHNAGIERNPYGCLAASNQIRINFAASDTGNNWLWSYRIHSIFGNLSD